MYAIDMIQIDNAALKAELATAPTFTENEMEKMTGKEALAVVGRYAPCPHDNANTDIGNEKVWAKCDDCGTTFAQEDWPKARDAAQRFDDAVMRLNAEIVRQGELIRALKAELKDINNALDDPRTDLTLTAVEVIHALKAELAAVQDDLAALRLFAANLDATHNATLKEMQITMRQELAAAQKDAERYRWLRDHDNDLWITMIEAIKVGGEAMEAAIDAAMEAK